MSRRTTILLVLTGVLLVPSLALTQQARQRASQARRRGEFNPEQEQKRMLLGLKQRLGATTAEWKTLGPKVEKVLAAQRELGEPPGRPGVPPMMRGDRERGPDEFGGPPGQRRPGGFGDARRPAGPAGPPNADDRRGPPEEGEGMSPPEADSDVARAREALRETVDDQQAPDEDIVADLTAYRQARAKARAALDTARKDLQASVKPRQEAILVVMGLLE